MTKKKKKLPFDQMIVLLISVVAPHSPEPLVLLNEHQTSKSHLSLPVLLGIWKELNAHYLFKNGLIIQL